MSCEGRVAAHALCRACLLHPCFPQGLWSASQESTGEGGTPAFYCLRWRLRIGKDNLCSLEINLKLRNLFIILR